MIRFRSFSSGSAGNCYLLAHDGGALLIDAGVSVRRLKAFLQEDGLAPGDLGAVLITHDHGDHIRHLGSFCKRLGHPVWAPEVLHAAFFRHPFTRDCVGACRRVLPTDTWTQVVPGFSVRPFEVPHDATPHDGEAHLCEAAACEATPTRPDEHAPKCTSAPSRPDIYSSTNLDVMATFPSTHVTIRLLVNSAL